MKTFKTPLALMCGLALAALPVFAAEENDAEFQMNDKNRDGVMSPAETINGAQSMFGKIDTNRDGRVTPAELEAAWAGTDDSDTAVSRVFAKNDVNADGTLTSTEHIAGAAAVFVKVDDNGDGALSQDEFDAAVKAMKKDKKW